MRVSLASAKCDSVLPNLGAGSIEEKTGSKVSESISTTCDSDSCSSSDSEEVVCFQTSCLRGTLSTKLEDIDHVDKILNAYEATVGTVLSGRDRPEFERKILQKNIRFLGSQFFDHRRIFEEFLSREPDYTTKISKESLEEPYQQFVKQAMQVCTSYRSSFPSLTQQTVQKVAILFPGAAGGGHRAPAQALEQFFKSRNISVLTIDTDEAEARYSKVFFDMSKGDVYSEIFAKKGDLTRARKLWKAIDSCKAPRARKFYGDIRERLMTFMPDRIFTVAAHDPRYSTFSFQLSIPMTFVQTDQQYSPKLTKIFRTQCCAPDSAPLITCTSTNDFLEYYINGGVDSLSAVQSLQPYIIPLGIPVRMQFQPVSEEEKAQLRRENGIPEDALVCTVAAGHYAIENSMKEILQKLEHDYFDLPKPLHVFVISGANSELKQELEKQFPSRSEARPDLTFDIKGFLNGDQMAVCNKIADFWITKPGGSTSAEAIQMQKKVLYTSVCEYPWEGCNAQFLQILHLGQKLDSKRPLAEQIHELLAEEIETEKLPKKPWYQKLDEFLAIHQRPVPKIESSPSM